LRDNPVRAGLVQDPKDYRYGDYAAALVGAQVIRKGLMSFLQPKEWPKAATEYRRLLFFTGVSANGSGKKVQGSWRDWPGDPVFGALESRRPARSLFAGVERSSHWNQRSPTWRPNITSMTNTESSQ